MRDRDAKGRTVAPARLSGSECPWARLSEADVSLIKLLVELGVRQRRLAALFGVSQTMVSRISLGKAWAGVVALEAA